MRKLFLTCEQRDNHIKFFEAKRAEALREEEAARLKFNAYDGILKQFDSDESIIIIDNHQRLRV